MPMFVGYGLRTERDKGSILLPDLDDYDARPKAESLLCRRLCQVSLKIKASYALGEYLIVREIPKREPEVIGCLIA